MNKLKYIFSLIKNSPDFREHGFLPGTVLTNWAFFRRLGDQYDTDRVDMQVVAGNANLPWWDDKVDQPIVFDVETLPTNTRDVPLRDHTHDQLAGLLTHYRQHPKHHHKALGLYSILPHRDYWRAIKDPSNGGDEGYRRWQEENRFALNGLNDDDLSRNQGLVAYVDRVYPSLYFWYRNRVDTFAQYADANLREAAIYNKPIIAFVSPNEQQPGYPLWEPGQWAEMLSYVWNHPLVDGVWIWAINNAQQSEWDESAVWWRETMEVLA